MGKFDGCLLYSDIDGTFVNRNGQIPEINKKAIKYFMSEGGKFGLATGRASHSSDRFALEAGINIPGICYNGAMIYDYNKKETLYLEYPNDKSKEYIKEILKEFPNLGVEHVYSDIILCYNVNEQMKKHFGYEDFNYKVVDPDEIQDGWIKILFVDSKDTILKLQEFVEKSKFTEANFMRSSEYFCEMIPKNASKGNALKWMANHLNISMDKTFAIGDFYNDLSMIQSAHIGAFVENAPEDLKPQADVVMCTNENGAVAKFVEYIEQYITK